METNDFWLCIVAVMIIGACVITAFFLEAWVWIKIITLIAKFVGR
jgi:hypothetical protein